MADLTHPQVSKLLQQIMRKQGIPTAEEEALQAPDITPPGLLLDLLGGITGIPKLLGKGIMRGAMAMADSPVKEFTIEELRKLAASRGAEVSEKAIQNMAPKVEQEVVEEAPKLVKQATKRAAKAPAAEKPWENVFTSASDEALKPSTIDYPALRSATAPYDKQVQDTMGQLMDILRREPKDKQADWMNQISKIITKDPERFAVKGDMQMAGAQRLAHLNQLTELLNKLKTSRGIAR